MDFVSLDVKKKKKNGAQWWFFKLKMFNVVCSSVCSDQKGPLPSCSFFGKTGSIAVGGNISIWS